MPGDTKMKYLFVTFVTLLCVTIASADTTYVCGTIVSQTWTPAGSPYVVTCNIFVAGLTIQPGVKVVFNGNYVFEVGGTLTAIGTAQDSIIFERADASIGWQGIYFNFSNPGSELAYCRISGSQNSGIRINSSYPNVHNCTIAHNSSTSGAGIRVWNTTDFTLTDCKVSENSAYDGSQAGRGGGIYITIGRALLTRCEISRNSLGGWSGIVGGGVCSFGSLTMRNCTVRGNSVSNSLVGPFDDGYAYVGGVYGSDTTELRNCIIDSNSVYAHSTWTWSTTHAYGGGVFSPKRIILLNCVMSYNTVSGDHSSDWQGAGLFFSGSDTAHVINSTIAYNTNQGVRQYAGTIQMRNSIVFFNTPIQIAGTSVKASYCDVQDGYAGVGNINVNPVFDSTSNLQIIPRSNCIDAGDPDPSYNDSCIPPSLGTVRNDIGAHGGPGACAWLDTIIVGVQESQEAMPFRFSLSQNYPNPFNPTTQIRYALPAGGFVSLKVFNVLGSEVATLVNEQRAAGSYEVEFNAGHLSSGIYFYRLQAGTFVDTKKFILLK